MFFIVLQYLLPQHLISRFVGMLAHSTWGWVKWPFIGWFSWQYGVDLSEAEHTQAKDYPSFNAFFTRALKPGVRSIAEGESAIVSPADGKVAEIGEIKEGQLLHAKRAHLSVHALLGGGADAEPFEKGQFITLYLAPKDYHRVHMPCDMTVTHSVYIPGKLFSVNPLSVSHIPGLFARNERLVVFGTTPVGKPVAVVMVGALIVASITTVWDGVVAPRRPRSVRRWAYPAPLDLKKGEQWGCFQLGSTVIVVYPEHTVAWEKDVVEGQAVQVGQYIGHYSDHA